MTRKQSREHKSKQIATLNPQWGNVAEATICPTADNNSCVIIIGRQAPEGTKAALDPKDEDTVRGIYGPPSFDCIVWNGQIMAETGIYELPKFSISFDGKRLATCVRRSDKQRGFIIRINGELVYEAPFDEFFDLVWIGNDELGWVVGNRGEEGRRIEGGLRYFVNGKETTGEVEFRQALSDRRQHMIHLWQLGTFCVVNDHGERKHIRPVSADLWRNNYWPKEKEKPEQPKVTRPKRRGPSVISYRGQKYDPVDELEDNGGMRTFAFNADRSKIAYIAIRHGKIMRGVVSALMSPMFLQDKVQDWAKAPGLARGEYNHISSGRGLVLKIVKVLCWAPSWIGVLLCNPYFGLFNALFQSSKRWYPVDNGKYWRKGYSFATDHFYTPQEELVVTAFNGHKACVVIGQDEGPLFDEIDNVRFIQQEGAVCYLARQGENIYRVTVG